MASGAEATAAQGNPSSPTTTLGILTSEWSLGEVDTGTRATVVVDLVAPQTSASAAENASGILRPAFPLSFFTTYLLWRTVVSDWSATGGGDAIAFTLRFEARSDPSKADSDGDGLSDHSERVGLQTLPVASDSDLDGLTDDRETTPRPLTLIIEGTATTLPPFTTDPLRWDTDGDGLGDGQESGLSQNLTGITTDPRRVDTDGDGLSDGLEVLTHFSDPTRRDGDGDTIPDAVEITPRPLTFMVGGATWTRTITTLPYSNDTDGDGLKDDREASGTTRWGVVTDPTDPDTDDDGLYDGAEAYVKEFSRDGRAPLGTGGFRTLEANAQGPIDGVEVRYATSGSDISSLSIRIDHNGYAGPTIRSGGGSGYYLHESRDITTAFAALPPTGSYTLHVSAPAGGVVLEEFSIRFTIRTSPIVADGDGDGLTDREELEHGQDGWLTDPNTPDSDGDGWSDGYEPGRGTSPLAADTDYDGIRDPADVDPLRNLLVGVMVISIHHGSSGWTPKLAGAVTVSDEVTFVTPHTDATEDCDWWQCTTSVFYDTYYFDVPDDRPTVNVRVQAWSINWYTGDHLLLDRTTPFTLGSFWGVRSYSDDGKHWMRYDVWTVRLDRVRTFAVTDGQITVTDQYGTLRYASEERFTVLLLRAASPYGQLAGGLNAILVPQAIFPHTLLRARLGAGETWPLGGATFYDGDAGRATMSEPLAGLIAGDLPGDQSYQVLQWVLQDEQGVYRYQAVDVTSRLQVLNAPRDVVRIVPWVGYENSPTGPMPIGSIWTKFVNALVVAGQLLYSGLLAVANFFVDLAQAIYDWGMRALGLISEAAQAVQATLQKAADVFVAALNWAKDVITGMVNAILQPFLSPISDAIEAWGRSVRAAIAECVVDAGCTATALATILATKILEGTLFLAVLGVVSGIALIEASTKPILGLATEMLAFAIDVVKWTIIAALIGLTLPTDYSGSHFLADLIPKEVDGAVAAAFTAIDLSIALSLYLATHTRVLKTLSAVAPVGLAISINALMLWFMCEAISNETREDRGSRIACDGVELAIAAFALTMDTPSFISRFYVIVDKVGDVLGTVSIVAGLTSLVRHVSQFMTLG